MLDDKDELARLKAIAVSRAWYKANKERKRNYQRKYRLKNLEKERERVRKTRRKREYGLTPESFQNMLQSQENKCAICNELFQKTPHVDHCHLTGVVRGLLCNGCNTGVGWIERHHGMWVKSAMKYLKINLNKI